MTQIFPEELCVYKISDETYIAKTSIYDFLKPKGAVLIGRYKLIDVVSAKMDCDVEGASNEEDIPF